MNHDLDAALWASLAPPRTPAPKLEGPLATDVVVIGGGLTGLSAAYHLAASGHKVALLEGRRIGWGGSGRNNGQVIPTLAAMEPAAMQRRYGDRAEAFIHMVRNSADTMFAFIREHNLACDAAQTGWFQPAHTPAHLRLSETRVAAWQKHGAPATLLDKPACDALLGSAHWHGGMLNPTGGHLNPLKLCHEMARICTRQGVDIYEATPATSVTRKGDGWQVGTAEGRIEAKAVLLASNAYTDQKLAPALARSIVPLSAYQLATTPLTEAQRGAIIPARQAVSDTRGDLWYFRYTADHRLVTGAALLRKARARARLQTLLKWRLETAFPQLAPLDFTHIWQGFVGITSDFTPRFHMLGPQYYAFTGYNGRGLALTLAVGREFANKINGTPCALPFDPPREISLHGIVKRVARSRLILTRLQDKQKPKV